MNTNDLDENMETIALFDECVLYYHQTEAVVGNLTTVHRILRAEGEGRDFIYKRRMSM